MIVIVKTCDGDRYFELSDEEFERFELMYEENELIGGDNLE